MTGLGALTRWTRQLVASLLFSAALLRKQSFLRTHPGMSGGMWNFSCLTFSALNKHNKGLKTLKHKWMIKTNASTATYEEKNTNRAVTFNLYYILLITANIFLFIAQCRAIRSDTRFKKPWRRLDFIPRFLAYFFEQESFSLALLPATRSLKATVTTQHPRKTSGSRFP